MKVGDLAKLHESHISDLLSEIRSTADEVPADEGLDTIFDDPVKAAKLYDEIWPIIERRVGERRKVRSLTYPIYLDAERRLADRRTEADAPTEPHAGYDCGGTCAIHSHSTAPKSEDALRKGSGWYP